MPQMPQLVWLIKPSRQEFGDLGRPVFRQGHRGHIGAFFGAESNGHNIFRFVYQSFRQTKAGYMGDFIAGRAHDHGIGGP
ncbi:MAG: hypothetical protein R2860_01030 [Desulfobacterales bacterium]